MDTVTAISERLGEEGGKLTEALNEGGAKLRAGLAKGVALVNEQRRAQGQDTLADQEDHFHTLREGRRARW